MREERNQIAGDLVVAEPMNLWGTVIGKVTVKDGGKLYARGLICGDLVVEDGGRVHVLGTVGGDLLVSEKAKVINSGKINGSAINKGGRLHMDTTGSVAGKIKTRGEGRTTYEKTE